MGWNGCASTAIALALLFAGSSLGAVLRVDKAQPPPPDVYSTIQAAVDASAPNDTISIADGRYAELDRYVFPSGDVVYPVVAIEHAPLTLIGDSRDGVRIGPSYYIGPLGDGLALCIASPVDDLLLTFESLTLENTFWLMSTPASVRLNECSLSTPGQGGIILFGPPTIEVSSSVFFDIETGVGIAVLAYLAEHTEQLRVSDTTFMNCGDGISVLGVEQVNIEGCRFIDCGTGTQFDDDTVGTITNSWYEGCGTTVLLFDGSRCHLERVVSLGNLSQGLLSEHGHFSGSHNYIEGGAGAAVQVRGTGTISMQNSTFLNGGEYTVSIGSRKSYFPLPTPRFDLRNNYWGTLDTAQIEAWILDGADYDHLIEVDFEPILPESPVSASRSSVGRIKSLFRAMDR